MPEIKSDFFQVQARIIQNIKVAPDYYKMVIGAPQIAKKALPGQFVNLRVSDKYEPLLRRPLSIYRVSSSAIEVLYKVVGVGTKILSQKKPKDKIDILGPLGSGFSILDARSSILVGGGMGIAPLLFLAEQTRIQYPESSIRILIGAMTKKEILCEKEFKDLGCQVKISTDNGSRGFKGKVTTLLKELLSSEICHLRSVVYACGPKPMLKEIASISKKYKIPAQISLEEHMACGIGVCSGCVVETRDGQKRVCKDGPVFDAKEVVF